MAERGWRLCRDDLAMSVQETVTAPAGVRRQRQVANAWRLGFDALQRDLSGRDIYLPVPSLAYGRMPGTFDDFCRWAAERKSLSLPARVDWPRYEAEGFQRLGEVTRLELVRHLFRRPLEIWLALDRVRLMEEAGFQVRLGTFCERDVTPRNLLIEQRRLVEEGRDTSVPAFVSLRCQRGRLKSPCWLPAIKRSNSPPLMCTRVSWSPASK